MPHIFRVGYNELTQKHFAKHREAMEEVKRLRKAQIENRIKPGDRAPIEIEKLEIEKLEIERVNIQVLLYALNGNTYAKSIEVVWPKPKAD